MKLMGAVQAINFLILLKSGQADRAGFLVALSFTNIHLQVLDDFLHSLTVAAFVDIEDAKHDEWENKKYADVDIELVVEMIIAENN